MLQHYQPAAAAMKLQILSDLHTEFSSFEAPATDADVVVLAGDIGVGTGGIRWAARQFPEAPVVYVPGNHEFYDGDIGDTQLLHDAAPAKLRVLNDDSTEIEGVRFLGCTLWTDFNFDGEAEAFGARQRAKSLIADFTAIRHGNRTFTPEDAVELHKKSVAWLVDELQQPFDGPTVVVTHHLPASPSIADRYKDHPLNPAFASRLEDLIERFAPALWIHGHTHAACDYQLTGTRVVCNPRGYPSESSDNGFSPGLVVKV